MKMVVPQAVIEMRINRLREKLAEKSLDALVLINEEKRGWENLYYLSGFRGSSAVLVVTHNTVVVSTDSRYVTQARQQCCVEVREVLPRESQIESIMRLVSDLKLITVAFDDSSISAQTYLKLVNIPLKLTSFAARHLRP